MKVQFRVASLEPQKVEREVTIDDQKHRLLVPTVIAQLVPVKDDGTGTVKLAIYDAEDLECFTVGAAVNIQLSAE